MGVPVVTRNTAGVQDLLKQFPEIIKSYSTIDEGVARVRELSGLKTNAQFDVFLNFFQDEQNTSLRRLVSHWL